jgi:hypothetical protein
VHCDDRFTTTALPAKGKCYKCGRRGHKAKYCYGGHRATDQPNFITVHNTVSGSGSLVVHGTVGPLGGFRGQGVRTPDPGVLRTAENLKRQCIDEEYKTARGAATTTN